MENKIKTFKWLVCGAMAIALISFYMPFVSAGSYHTYSSTGFDLLTMAMEDGEAGFLVLALLGTVAGLTMTLVGLKQDSHYRWLLILSVVSGGSVWLYFSEGMDYVTNGFWLFLVAHVASAVLCGMICSNAKSSAENTEATDKEQTNG